MLSHVGKHLTYAFDDALKILTPKMLKVSIWGSPLLCTEDTYPKILRVIIYGTHFVSWSINLS